MYYIEGINKNLTLNTQDSIELVFIYSKKLIEKLIFRVDDSSSNYFKKLKSMSNNNVEVMQAWNYINTYQHYKDESFSLDASVQSCMSSLILILKNVFPGIEKKIEWALKVDEIKWMILDEKKSGYPAIIVNSKYNMEENNFINETVSLMKGFKQLRSTFIYTDVPLSPGAVYIIKADVYGVLINGEDYKIQRRYCKKPMIRNIAPSLIYHDLVESINLIMNKYNRSIVDLLTIDNNYILTENELKILRSHFVGKNWKWVSRAIIFLAFSAPEIINDNVNISYDGPLFHEFWTKNPKVKGLSIFNKKKILAFLMGVEGFDGSNLFGYENALFTVELKKEKAYFKLKPLDVDIKKLFPDNNKFVQSQKRYFYDKVIELDGYLFNHKTNSAANTFLELKQQNVNSIDINSSISLSTIQRDVLINILSQRYSVLYGQAGSGKTRLAAAFISSVLKTGESILVLAKTRRASQIVNEMGLSIDELDHVENITIAKFLAKPFNYSEFKNVIIDECSMIDDEDWIKLKVFLTKSKRLVLIGDGKQLPPMMSVGLFDHFLMKKWFNIPTFVLNENWRQKDDKTKRFVEFFRKNDKFSSDADFLVKYSSVSDLYSKVKSLGSKGFKFISPVNGGFYGVNLLNLVLAGGRKMGPGSKVMITKTSSEFPRVFQNRELTVKEINSSYIIFNEIDNQKYLRAGISSEGWYYENAHLCFKFGDEPEPFIFSKVQTVHNSQGSTMENVCVVVPRGYTFDRRMMYTALSRVKGKLFILHYGSSSNILE